MKKTCEIKIKRIFPGGVFHVAQTIFQKMQELGINIPEELCFYPFRATFDFECYFDTSHLPPNSPKVHWLARHEILSVSICSNVPGFSLVLLTRVTRANWWTGLSLIYIK